MRLWSILLTALLVATPAAFAQRVFPSTVSTTKVFNDQLATWSMSEAQFRFAASRYVGTQKVRRIDARHLRQYNPEFLVLHYRLGQALGHSWPSGCAPTADMLQIVHGDDWVQEWPGDASVEETWFFHWSAPAQRVFSCSNGHYLADLDDPSWRAWWSTEVLQELSDNENDGLFADSYSVPNYFGGCDWSPCLPAVDPAFELAWAERESAFSGFMQSALASGGYKWLPNLGAMITSRDPSNWSGLDGAMVEGFAEWGGGNYFDESDWVLQMNRILPLAAGGKILLAQTYPSAADTGERLFVLGSYLLIRGAHVYLNLDLALEPEWFPEYGIYLGRAQAALPAEIGDLWDAGTGAYVREFANGRVVVNPSNASHVVPLGVPLWVAIPNGGGLVPSTGVAPGSLAYSLVNQVTLGPHRAAILVEAPTLLFADDFESGDLSSW